jgi:hypothetical protein
VGGPIRRTLKTPLTTISQFGPNTVDAWKIGLPTKPSLGADFSSEECDLTSEFLQLVHHGVDGTLEQSDFRIHFLSMDQDLLAQIAHSDRSDNGADLTESLLESKIGLLMLTQLTLQGTDVLDAVLESHVLVVQLLVDLSAEVVDVLALVLDLVGLLVQVIAQVVELLLGQGSGGLLGVAIGLLCGQPVADPGGALLLCRAAAVGRAASAAPGTDRGIDQALLWRLASRCDGEGARVDGSMALVLKEVYSSAEGGELRLELRLLGAVRARKSDGIGGGFCAVGGDLGLERGIAGRVVGSREVLDVVCEASVGFRRHGCDGRRELSARCYVCIGDSSRVWRCSDKEGGGGGDGSRRLSVEAATARVQRRGGV